MGILAKTMRAATLTDYVANTQFWRQGSGISRVRTASPNARLTRGLPANNRRRVELARLLAR